MFMSLGLMSESCIVYLTINPNTSLLSWPNELFEASMIRTYLVKKKGKKEKQTEFQEDSVRGTLLYFKVVQTKNGWEPLILQFIEYEAEIISDNW